MRVRCERPGQRTVLLRLADLSFVQSVLRLSACPSASVAPGSADSHGAARLRTPLGTESNLYAFLADSAQYGRIIRP